MVDQNGRRKNQLSQFQSDDHLSERFEETAKARHIRYVQGSPCRTKNVFFLFQFQKVEGHCTHVLPLFKASYKSHSLTK